jgi:formate dehydrogenase (coenzyme F420) beta subunit
MSRVREVDKKSVDEKYAYWQKKLSRCIRCYACRNVCPACNCRECIFDKNAPRWIGKANELSEKQNYNIVRSFHIAGRCIDCGECQRACPMDIPLMEINRKIMQDLEELYGEYEAGLDPTGVPPLGTYRAEDPAGFSER